MKTLLEISENEEGEINWKINLEFEEELRNMISLLEEIKMGLLLNLLKTEDEVQE